MPDHDPWHVDILANRREERRGPEPVTRTGVQADEVAREAEKVYTLSVDKREVVRFALGPNRPDLVSRRRVERGD